MKIFPQVMNWGLYIQWLIPSFLHISGNLKVQAGAEIDNGPVTPLHLAARHGHLEVLKAMFFSN